MMSFFSMAYVGRLSTTDEPSSEKAASLEISHCIGFVANNYVARRRKLWSATFGKRIEDEIGCGLAIRC